MLASPDQLRAARVLLRLEQAELAHRAQTSTVTIRRLEAPDGHRRVAPATIASIQTALERAGAEFIPHGVRRRQPPDTLLDDLRAISHRSAARLQGQPTITEAEADLFLTAIASAPEILLSAVNLLETSMVLATHTGDPASWTDLDAFIARAAIQIVPQDAALTDTARHAFLRYGKGRHPAALNLGDCAAYALAKSRALPLLFKGNDFSQTDLTSSPEPVA